MAIRHRNLPQAPGTTEPFDLVVEGTASRVTDADELAAVCAAYVDQGWPAEVEGDALTAEFSRTVGGQAAVLRPSRKPVPRVRVRHRGTVRCH